jgi:DNA polymerase III subunit delta'
MPISPLYWRRPLLTAVQEQDEGVRFLRRIVDGSLKSPLLLVGDEGVGRRFSVRQAAKEAWSKGNKDSIHCIQVDREVHPDLVTVGALDGKEIGIDAVRELIDTVYSFPSMARIRYVIIDGADTLTGPAANALLKTLEEPPSTTRFFLLTQATETVLPTIRSRCGLVRYRPLSEAFIVRALSDLERDPTKSLVCARLAEGSVGRAVKLWASGGLGLRDRVLSLLKVGLGGDLSSLFLAVDEIGTEFKTGLRYFEHLLHDLIMLPHDPTRLTNLDIVDELRGLRTSIGEKRIEALRLGVREIQRRMWAKIQVQFHVKTLLAAVFTG